MIFRFGTAPGLSALLLLFAITASTTGYAQTQGGCLDVQLPVSQCQQDAKSIAGNFDQLMQLGGSLEESSQFEKAQAVYQVADKQYPDNRQILQSLIRARASWREQRADFPVYINSESERNSSGSAPPKLEVTQQQRTDCFHLRWKEALSACEAVFTVHQQDVAVVERLGDVHRGLGQVDQAMQFYTRAIRLQPNNLAIKRKMRVLQQSVDGNDQAEPYVPANTPESPPTIPVNQQIDSNAINHSTPKRLTPADSALDSRRYHALIIGNNSYDSRIFPDLQTAVADAQALADVLRKRYGFTASVLTDASRYDTMKAIADYRKRLTEKDKFLIYYAGHGVLDDATQRGYWLPTDAEPDNPANWISADDVISALHGMNAKHVMVIADSCFSGSLLRNTTANQLDERGALLLRLSQKRSRTVMTSGGLEPVQDNGGGRHSVFAKALLSVLGQNEGVLEAGRLFVQLRDQVILKADQTPQYAPIRQAGHDGGDFLFVPR